MIGETTAARWTKAPPEGALRLKSLIFGHRKIVDRLARILGARGEVQLKASDIIEVGLGDRGFQITADGVEPWVASTDRWGDGLDGRSWKEIQKPWEPSSDLGQELWDSALQEFDGLVRSGQLELAGRFESLCAPASFIPPGGLEEDIWHTPKVDFEKGVIVLNNGEIVYDVHILAPAHQPTEAPRRPTLANGVDRLAQFIRAAVTRSPLVRTYTKSQLSAEAKRVGCAVRNIPEARRRALADFPPETQRAWGPGRSRNS